MPALFQNSFSPSLKFNTLNLEHTQIMLERERERFTLNIARVNLLRINQTTKHLSSVFLLNHPANYSTTPTQNGSKNRFQVALFTAYKAKIVNNSGFLPSMKLRLKRTHASGCVGNSSWNHFRFPTWTETQMETGSSFIRSMKFQFKSICASYPVENSISN